MKQLSKDEIAKLTNINEEIYNKVPFFTPFQEEAQSIIKELWAEQEGFLVNCGKLWLNEPNIKIDNKIPTLLLYSRVGKSIDKSLIYEGEDENYINNGFNIEIINFENYSPYETRKINILGTENEDHKSISLLVIMDMLWDNFLTISNLHEKIIKIYKSDLDKKTKKYCIVSIIDEIDTYIEENNYELCFKYSMEIIKDLNDLYLYHEWIKDSFIIRLALEAYQKITYYYKWLEKHKIEEKRFREKISTIIGMRKEYRILTSARPPFHERLPQHPQDILHGLVIEYVDYYGREKTKDGIQAIVKIISNYARMPKKSKQLKNMEEFNKMIMDAATALREDGATKEEVTAFIILKTYGKEVTYIGNEESN